jgi:chromosome segregation protein
MPMHLKSLTVKGFKSFPDRTRLDFGPGVSVIVGPNGSGKSNVTDALLWAMGEQSPLAVRGSSMQDVIFGGGRGVQARSSAEVEIVLDNSDGTVELPLSEISIVRRLDRSGEGEYRLNGARCRLVDVIEVLSDTGLGKETHSVISQGRVEAIVMSKPRERRMLIEEAAGLGKHRKRRRRAQLKLERTQENLDRALDVEREARSRLRPLKRQAEAAELHERLRRQMLEVRLELAIETVRASGEQLLDSEAAVTLARAKREEIERRLAEIGARRSRAESALAQRAERHDEISKRAYAIRSAKERLQLRGEQAATVADTVQARAGRIQLELAALEQLAAQHTGEQESESEGRIGELEEQLAQIEREREAEVERALVELQAERERAESRVRELEEQAHAMREARERAEESAEGARAELRAAQARAERARGEAARVGAELASANQFLRAHARSGVHASSDTQARLLSEALQVEPGYELALAAALGGRLDGALVADLDAAASLLDKAGPDGAVALLAGEAAAEGDDDAQSRAYGRGQSDDRAGAPIAGAKRLLDLVRGSGAVLALAERMLEDAWVVERLEGLPESFSGIASTPSGRVLFAAWGEVRQATEGGAERVLARRNEREKLVAESESAVRAEQASKAQLEQLLERLRELEDAREALEVSRRDHERNLAAAREEQHSAEWLIEQRRAAPEQGPLAVRRAELQGELAAERRAGERLRAERGEREQRIARLRAQHAADTTLAPRAERLARALADLPQALDGLLGEVEEQLSADRAQGEVVATELRECAAAEAAIQSELRAEGELVTAAEVAAQRLRDQAAEAMEELRAVCERLELPVPDTTPSAARASADSGADEWEGEEGRKDASGTPPEPARLDEEQKQALEARLERLRRRREQLGPVNPLAKAEYDEALAHVEELETRRSDLETALRELRSVIRETDRQIHETFQATFSAAASNFEELVSDVFPGGSGRLRLVSDEQAPRPVIGGENVEQDGATGESGEEADNDEEARLDEDALGVEIEITPAGKSTKRLSLLSGGEKSMTALAFLFAVFLARPCPFYVLDEVEAALDDLNLDRFLDLLRRYANRAQFIVITHQKRTMEAADWLYGVSMAENGVSKVLSRRLPREERPVSQVAPVS